MQKFAIYQLSDENPKIRDMYFMSADEVEAISDEYDLVGLVSAQSFDHVFTIGNMQRSKVEVVGEMRSVSVGDILVNLTTGETVIVANIGFKQITMKEAV